VHLLNAEVGAILPPFRKKEAKNTKRATPKKKMIKECVWKTLPLVAPVMLGTCKNITDFKYNSGAEK
jgi:hypothetical protein